MRVENRVQNLLRAGRIRDSYCPFVRGVAIVAHSNTVSGQANIHGEIQWTWSANYVRYHVFHIVQSLCHYGSRGPFGLFLAPVA